MSTHTHGPVGYQWGLSGVLRPHHWARRPQQGFLGPGLRHRGIQLRNILLRDSIQSPQLRAGEVPCLSCTPDGSLESPCQTSDCCSTGRHVECQCPRLAPVPGLRCPRTTGSRFQLAVSVSSELKSWPRRVLAEVLLAGHFSIRPAPGASGVRAGPASPPLGEAPTAGFLGAWASASRDTTQEHLATRLYPVTTAESREVPCLSCTPDGSLESPCQTSDCCSTGRHVECQCPRLAPVPGLCHPRTTGSWLQLAVSVSSELKSWPRRVLAEVLLAGHFSIRPDPCVTGCLFSSECVKIQRFTDTGTMILLSLSF
nr:uncharacterized protein LOC103346825 [Oryctolagus cuniculus]